MTGPGESGRQLLVLLAGIGIGVAVTSLWRARAQPREEPQDWPRPYVWTRPAGADSMRDPPRDWDRVDEAVDQSFPASDPPSFWSGPPRHRR